MYLYSFVFHTLIHFQFLVLMLREQGKEGFWDEAQNSRGISAMTVLQASNVY